MKNLAPGWASAVVERELGVVARAGSARGVEAEVAREGKAAVARGVRWCEVS